MRDAVSRAVEGAFDQLLTGTMWQVPGYEINATVAFLGSNPCWLSEAGELLGRDLRHPDAPEEQVTRATEFWRAAIETKSPEGLHGFGCFVLIETLDDDIWLDLVSETLKITRGRIKFATGVAERVARIRPSAVTLRVMDALVRGLSGLWNGLRVQEVAKAHLEAAATDLSGTDEYGRLRTALQERGAL